jgi:hypothetical protein
LNRLAFSGARPHSAAMALSSEPVTLSAEQVEEMQRKLGKLRHDINNNLSLIVAAVELIKHNPDMFARMVNVLSEQPPKIAEAMRVYSSEFEKALGIGRS